MSNWTRVRLTEAQITYAATDAWVSRELGLRLLPLRAVLQDDVEVAHSDVAAPA